MPKIKEMLRSICFRKLTVYLHFSSFSQLPLGMITKCFDAVGKQFGTCRTIIVRGLDFRVGRRSFVNVI
jgi:hypothetical protein